MTIVVAVGDIMLGDSTATVGFGLHSSYPGASVSSALSTLRSLTAGADVAIGNLECVLTKRGLGASRLERDQMRGDPEYALALRAAGFDALGVANNHAVQHGTEAFEETVRHLRQAGILPIGLRGTDGWSCEPAKLRTRAGQTVGILGYCMRPRQYSHSTPPYAEGNRDAVLQDIRRLRAECDSTVVSLHWGEEFVTAPSISEFEFAGDMVAAGADVIVGHHPHVTRPVEFRANGVVAYSLGNAISDMHWMEELRRGLALRVNLRSQHLVADVVDLFTDDKYHIRVLHDWRRVSEEQAAPLDASEYEAAIRQGLSRQRRALYRFTLSSLLRYPLDVSTQLVLTTAMNKLSGMRE